MNTLFIILFQIFTRTSEAKTEMQLILHAAFCTYGMSYYLDYPPANKQQFFFRFEKPPIYQGTTLQKQISEVPYRQKRIVKYDTKLGDDKNRVVIIVEAIVVEKNTATVKLWIPYNGVMGSFSLRKVKFSWVVTNAVVEQT